jgi:uncharacterized protein YciI
MSEKSTFIYVLNLVRHQALERMTPNEEAIVDEHFEYLKNRLNEGKLVLAGRCLEGEFGIVIFNAESEKQAVGFMKNDPTIKKGLMTAELHPFRIALIKNNSTLS